MNNLELSEELRKISQTIQTLAEAIERGAGNSASATNSGDEPPQGPMHNYGTFTDPRDGKVYKTIKIGTQVWLAENLAFECKGSKIYNNDPENLAKYGWLYDWETAKKACPTGWHLPTNEEWDELYRFVDGTSGTDSPYNSLNAGRHLKATSGWSDGNGLDSYGFSALPGGLGYSGGYFHYAGDYGLWWSATENDSDYAYNRRMYCYGESAGWNYDDKNYLFSVRCLKDREDTV